MRTINFKSHWKSLKLGLSNGNMLLWVILLIENCLFFQVKTWAYKLWKENLENVVTLDNSYFIFKIKNESALKSILDEGPYYIGSKLIVIKKWHRGMQL